ncbi:MAG: aspartate--tRNA ligase, partial [Bdellovibrionales bacterium]|nr:aspartate--tRNA ligase [Bdellovibrionales bacterium]
MAGKYVSEVKRSHYCGKLNKQNVGETVTLMGWVDTRRDHGGLVFVDLRDREGFVQLVMDPNLTGNSAAKDVRNEYVIAVTGTVRARPDGMINKKISTGEVEVVVERCELLSRSESLPFQASDPNVSESVRLKYRYLDLRSERMQSNLKLRHKFCQTVRNVLS